MWMIDFLRILFFQQGSQCPFVFLCSCQTELFVTSSEFFGTSSDIFGYYRTPPKNLGTIKIKNVTPINVKRLAGILPDTLSVCCYTFWYNIFPIINKRITNFKISLLFLTLLLATFTHDRRVKDSNKWRQTNNLS